MPVDPKAPASGRAAVPRAGGARPGSGRISGRAAVPVRGYADDAGEPPGGRPPTRTGRPRRRWRRIAVVTALVLAVGAVLGTGGLLWYAHDLDSNMARTDAFQGIDPQQRPAKPIESTFNALILGSDSRDPDGTAGKYRADTIILLHVPSDRSRAFLISIPRDLWVYIPPTPDGSKGGFEDKINSATAHGGVPLMVQTVENYTGVRIDHVILVDFGGFVEVTDALGGVEMDIEQTITSIHKPYRTFEAGRRELRGEEALDYIRQRMQFPDGDFTRMRNQQQFLRALMDKATSTGTLTNPARLNAFLQTVTRALTVDEDLSLIDAAMTFRNLRSDDLTFLTSPHAGTGMAGGQSVVFSDDERAADLYEAVRQDRLAQWLEANPDA
ncbi:MAG TPA: LCP family protein [Natronosporangium sp.]|nr:LCP family protein [Natronosporangium sp.]